VLVDESSMLDLALAERLLRSLPQGGRVVLLGDAQQLPSVEAGSVFRDLVAAAAGSGRVARLTHSFRMDARDPAGSAILELAAAISTGRSPLSAIALREDAAAVAFTGAELLSSPPAPLASFLARWWQWRTTSLPGWEALVEREWHAEAGLIVAAELPDLATLFTHHESARLLSATRGWSGGTGAAALNAWFRAALVGALGERRRGARSDAQPIPGEPVLVTRNDYRRALYNGDQGVVLRVAAEGEPAAPMAVLRVPGGGFRALPLASLRGHLEPAWASTVHKAQGSEHDAVALVLPAVENRLLTRELLYTAVTRARHSVVVVGTADRLAAAAARAIERWSGIAEALAAETGAPATAAVPRQQLRLFPE
jgi:exodeoxyribonuclease V alpha subunit